MFLKEQVPTNAFFIRGINKYKGHTEQSYMMGQEHGEGGIQDVDRLLVLEGIVEVI